MVQEVIIFKISVFGDYWDNGLDFESICSGLT